MAHIFQRLLIPTVILGCSADPEGAQSVASAGQRATPDDGTSAATTGGSSNNDTSNAAGHTSSGGTSAATEEDGPVGPAPNDREPGSGRYFGHNYDAWDQATRCYLANAETNNFIISLNSAIIYKGDPTKVWLTMHLPADDLSSGLYGFHPYQDLSLEGVTDKAVLKMSLGPHDETRGWGADGALWVQRTGDSLTVRWEDVSMNSKSDHTGKEISKASGAAHCPDIHED